MRTKQLTHKEVTPKQQRIPIDILCDGVQSPANVGGILRLADAFGARQVFFGNAHIDLKSTRLKRTARNTHKVVNHTCVDDLKEILISLKAKNILTIGIEITNDSKDISLLRTHKAQEFALVLGHERHGISQEVLNHLDACYHIPMQGVNSSMNVTQACAIALYLLNQKLK